MAVLVLEPPLVSRNLLSAMQVLYFRMLVLQKTLGIQVEVTSILSKGFLINEVLFYFLVAII